MFIFGTLGQWECKCLLYCILYFSVDLNILQFIFIKTCHKRKESSYPPALIYWSLLSCRPPVLTGAWIWRVQSYCILY